MCTLIIFHRSQQHLYMFETEWYILVQDTLFTQAIDEHIRLPRPLGMTPSPATPQEPPGLLLRAQAT